MCEEKRLKICLIPARPFLLHSNAAGGKAENVANSGAMGKFSNPPAGGRNFKLFNLCDRFFKGFYQLTEKTV
jgi:hypothetical protein